MYIPHRRALAAMAAVLVLGGCASSPQKCNPLKQVYQANSGMANSAKRIKSNVADYQVASGQRTAILTANRSLVGDIPLNAVGEPVNQLALEELIKQRIADGGILASQMIDGGCGKEVKDLTEANSPKRWYEFWRYF